jgi:hypothetical protein
MENMLRISNPGLSSRFAPENALEFEDFSDAELLLKFSMDCAALRAVARMSVKLHAVERLAKMRNMPNFGKFNLSSLCWRAGMLKRRQEMHAHANRW